MERRWIRRPALADARGFDIRTGYRPRHRWRDQALSLAPDGSAWSSHRLIDLQSVASLTIEATAEAPRLAHAMAVFARPKPLAIADMNRLATYGDRTLVAATASSRDRGAGSARSDND